MPTTAHEPLSLFEKRILITGGTTGIGRSTARCLVGEGAHVLIFGRHEQELNDAIKDIEEVGLGAVHGVIADQSKKEDVDGVFLEVDARLGGIDILVNNASVSAGSILDTDYDNWKYVLDVNILGYMACCRHAIDRMRNQGYGHIVNVGSMSAEIFDPHSDLYVATKSAVRGFSVSLRKKVNEMGIKVTLVEPGVVGTDMSGEHTPVEEQVQQEAEGKMLKAEDVAECICYALTQPLRCDVVAVQIRPHLQLI